MPIKINDQEVITDNSNLQNLTAATISGQSQAQFFIGNGSRLTGIDLNGYPIGSYREVDAPYQASNREIQVDAPMALNLDLYPELKGAFGFSGNGSGNQIAKIIAPTPTAQSFFGISVCFTSSGDLLAIGEYGKNSYRGSVYIYQKTGTVYNLVQNISLADAVNGDNFGFFLVFSPDDQKLIITAPQKTKTINNMTYRGVVYVYSRSGNTFTQESKIENGPADDAFLDNSSFGRCASISRNNTTIAIGCPGGSKVGNGSNFIYTLVNGVWQRQFVATGPSFQLNGPDSRSGVSIQLSEDGNTAIFADTGSGGGTPYLFIYSRNGNTWSQTQRIDNTGGLFYLSSDKQSLVSYKAFVPVAPNTTYSNYNLVNGSYVLQNTLVITNGSTFCANKNLNTIAILVNSFSSNGTPTGSVLRIYKKVQNQYSFFSQVSPSQPGFGPIQLSLVDDGSVVAGGSPGDNPQGLQGAGSTYVFNTGITPAFSIEPIANTTKKTIFVSGKRI